MFGVLPLLVSAAAVRLRLCRRLAPLPVRRVIDPLEALPAARRRDGSHRRHRVDRRTRRQGQLLLGGAVRRLQRPAGRGHCGRRAAAGRTAATGLAGQRRDPGRPRVCAVRPFGAAHVPPCGGSTAPSSPGYGGTPSPTLESLRSAARSRPTAHRWCWRGYRPTLAVWFVFVSSCPFFAFTLAAGRYLPLVELRRRAAPPLRLALFAAALTVFLVASFRAELSLVRRRDRSHPRPQPPRRPHHHLAGHGRPDRAGRVAAHERETSRVSIAGPWAIGQPSPSPCHLRDAADAPG